MQNIACTGEMHYFKIITVVLQQKTKIARNKSHNGASLQTYFLELMVLLK